MDSRSTPVAGFAGRVLDSLAAAPASIDELAAAMGAAVPELLEALAELELSGAVECRAGRYQRL